MPLFMDFWPFLCYNLYMEEMITISKIEYEKLIKMKQDFADYQINASNQIILLKNENARLEEALRLKKVELYARKIEKKTSEQISLFPEVDLLSKIDEVEDSTEASNETEVKCYKRKKRKNFINEIDETLFEKEIEDITIDEEGYRDIHSDEVTKILKVIPKKYIILEKHIHVYETTNKDGEKVLVRATDKNPNPLGKENVNVDFVVETIYEKFVNAVPLYRQEKEYQRVGIPISRMYLSSLIKKQVLQLDNLFLTLKEYVQNAGIGRSDETPLTVIKGVEKKEKIKQNAYIWAFSTGKSFHEATYYQVSDRSTDTVKEFYCGKNVKLMCDGYAAYYGLSNITPVSCMVHIRRKFANILKANKGERNSESNTSQIINMFAKIYNVENTIKSEESDFNRIKERRQNELKPLYDSLFSFIEKASLAVLPKSAFGEACSYAIKYKDSAYNVFTDGRLEIDNNESERKIKDIVIGRKNWLFCFTEAGAEITCKLYSLIMTALQNGIDPRKYLSLLITKFGINEMTKDEAKDYLPWSNAIKQECLIK